MIDIVTTQRRLEELPNELRKDNSRVSERLSELSNALAGGPTSEDWAIVDIYKVINVDAIADGVKAYTVTGPFL